MPWPTPMRPLRQFLRLSFPEGAPTSKHLTSSAGRAAGHCKAVTALGQERAAAMRPAPSSRPGSAGRMTTPSPSSSDGIESGSPPDRTAPRCSTSSCGTGYFMAFLRQSEPIDRRVPAFSRLWSRLVVWAQRGASVSAVIDPRSYQAHPGEDRRVRFRCWSQRSYGPRHEREVATA